VPILGKHTASNALAAIAVARSLRLSEEEIIQNLSVAHGPEMRLQRSEVAGITVLNDAYNANPHSMKAALETLAALTPKHRRVAILGDMRELGESSDRYHKEIGDYAAACKIDLLVCVGKQANLIAEAAERSAMPVGSICRFSDSQDAAKGVLKILQQGDLVLLKASRSMRLEHVAEAIAHSEPKFFRKAASSAANGSR
jgi:UDP-N-acetylmuramoyl-tripeptide--D-alanyl-D-alanine ligase